jgi:hypothetical protein
VLLEGLELPGVEPEAAAMRATVDQDAVELAAVEVVSVLGALHVMGAALGGDASRLRVLPLLLEQLLLPEREVLVFVLAGLLDAHGVLGAESLGGV